jgi:hypothetical protein
MQKRRKQGRTKEGREEENRVFWGFKRRKKKENTLDLNRR